MPVMRYCLSIVKDQDEAADIVQQSFIVLWQKRNDIQIHSSVRAYLYKVIYNTCIDHLRGNAARLSRQKKAIEMKPDVDDTNLVTQKELQETIEQAVNKLPAQCARIFRMSRGENLKYRQIADKLHISEKTVENQIGKALQLLRIYLKDYLPVFLLLILYYA
jgi:RNA polymerase sigma-70 factor (ECF subfamily)